MHFNPNLAAYALAASVTLISLGAQAGPIDIKVVGTITPGACVPSIASGGIFNYGIIDSEQVNQTSYTLLDEKELDFSINCTAPTKVALSTVDNRSSSRMSALETTLGADAPYLYGLGLASGVPIGSYVLRLKDNSFTADGSEVFIVSSNSAGSAWTVPTGENILPGPTFWRSWSDTAGGFPVEVTTLVGKISVLTALNSGANLPLTDDAELDGSATLTMFYL